MTGSGRGISPLPSYNLSRHSGRTVRESLLPAVVHAESCSILRSLHEVPFTQPAPLFSGRSSCLPAFRQVSKSLLHTAKAVPTSNGQINRGSACGKPSHLIDAYLYRPFSRFTHLRKRILKYPATNLAWIDERCGTLPSDLPTFWSKGVAFVVVCFRGDEGVYNETCAWGSPHVRAEKNLVAGSVFFL